MLFFFSSSNKSLQICSTPQTHLGRVLASISLFLARLFDSVASEELTCTALQRHTAVAAGLKSKQLLLFAFAWRCTCSDPAYCSYYYGHVHVYIRTPRDVNTQVLIHKRHWDERIPTDTKRLPNAVLIFAQRRRRWASIKTALFQRLLGLYNLA